MSSARRLEQLDKHTSAWKNLKWSREITIPMEDGTLWELFGGVLVQNTIDNRLHIWQLPSDLRGIEEKKWTLGPNFGFTMADVAMDPLQDLLVLIDGINSNMTSGYTFITMLKMIALVATSEFCVHLRTLSTGTPHPLSKATALHCPYEDEVDGSYCTQIFGDLVAVLFTPISFEEKMLMVWEWKTGRQLLVSIFLSENLYGLTHSTRNLSGVISKAFHSYPTIVS